METKKIEKLRIKKINVQSSFMNITLKHHVSFEVEQTLNSDF